MKLHVDKEAGALHLRLDDSKIIESEEIAPGVVVDYNRKNAVVGVEVLHLSRRTPKSKARKYPSPDTTAALAMHDKPAKKYGS
ncbi:MAG: DUF2283 domain-containing protein [Verrucomicrobiota bacterium]|jgi:uncharacterized protein YuzE